MLDCAAGRHIYDIGKLAERRHAMTEPVKLEIFTDYV